MSKVALGVTGSIAAYKAAEIISLFRKRNIDVKVVLTRAGAEFITPLTLETMSANAVVTDMFARDAKYEVEHISLAKWADIFLVAPATANFLAKYANGIADDFLTTTILATEAPVVIAPAMNTLMYEHPATVANMNTLKERGVLFIESPSGMLACGDVGRGRMAKPVDIVEHVKNMLRHQNDLKGKTVMVTGGATIEDIDPVRYLTNRSTGKMGISIANAAASRGAKVYFVSVSAHGLNDNVAHLPIRSANDMLNAVEMHIGECDAFLCAAAPADFTPKAYSVEKIKKDEGDGGLMLELHPTADILERVSRNKGTRIHIGFAAETSELEQNAIRKLENKNLDAIAANDITAEFCGFAGDTNAVTIFYKDGTKENTGLMKKSELAHLLLDRTLGLMLRK